MWAWFIDLISGVPSDGAIPSNAASGRPPAPRSFTGTESVEELEARKLRAEIAEIEKPFLNRGANWLSISAAVVAIVGVAGQAHLSSIRVERALLEAAEKLKTAEEVERDAQDRATQADAQRAKAVAAREVLDIEVAALTRQKRATESQIASVQSALADIDRDIDALERAGVPSSELALLRQGVESAGEALGDCTQWEKT